MPLMRFARHDIIESMKTSCNSAQKQGTNWVTWEFIQAPQLHEVGMEKCHLSTTNWTIWL